MRAATLDRLLALLVAAQLLTGLLTLRAGAPATAPLFAAHGILAGALAIAIGLKVWRSVPPAVHAGRWGPLAAAAVLGLLIVAALGLGFAWVISGRILTIGSWTVLTLHVVVALALVPILVGHLLPRRWRVLRVSAAGPAPRTGGPPISRRAALATLAMGAAGAVLWAAGNAVELAVGGARRFTGSRRLPDGGIPPATTFFGEAAPSLDADAWRLVVRGAVRQPLSLSLADLARLGEVEQDAILDCTSGWALSTTWRGVPLPAILAAAGAQDAGRVTVRSATGWNAAIPLDEAGDALLATGVAGQPLRTGNGAPCRLVLPQRRGLEWVKWVTEIEVA